MNKLSKNIKCFAVLVAVTLLSACTSTGQSRVRMVDSSERNHLDIKLNMTDFMAAADKLTNKMLNDGLVETWYENKPKLILGKIGNRTDVDINLLEEEIYDRIVDVILQSGAARIVGASSDAFDYILTGKVSSTTAEDAQKVQRQYRITLRVHTKDDELIGSWHEPISLVADK
ncbi:MAG: hypothetical protein ACI8WB_004185 [Phenylobacterium sp.]|jgi:hypothetical protein